MNLRELMILIGSMKAEAAVLETGAEHSINLNGESVCLIAPLELRKLAIRIEERADFLLTLIPLESEPSLSQ